ncbi:MULTISPECIES: SirB2 family protein [Deefgea]|uniref:Regulator SirB n=1 Tax=Deefgea chitinilytica TaxID=570276 RepID=A0ABS2CC37_9NEIS|nr:MULTISPECIES: SirB2 family protein [Deefgea]MBM5571706.1 regulator SirB [Deefgea chitinilytica]MBM9888941.1 SirB2 family protein [Deefgea sp. CFH1-16]
MEYYLDIKHLHISLVTLSGVLFLLRGLLMLKSSKALQMKTLRIAPHIIDTGLLIAGVSLAVMLGLKPSETPWIMAKLIALIVYIGLGTIAIKRGKTLAIRASAFVAALATFGYMIAVAVTKTPIPWA